MRLLSRLLRIAVWAVGLMPLAAAVAVVIWSLTSPEVKLRFHVGNRLLAVASVERRLHVLHASFQRPLPKTVQLRRGGPIETVEFKRWYIKVWCPGVGSFSAPFAALKALLLSRTLGFHFEKMVFREDSVVVREFQVPHWPLIAAGALIAFGPLPLQRRAMRRRRARLGLCVACGYDLRGTPGDRCSECGATRSASR